MLAVASFQRRGHAVEMRLWKFGDSIDECAEFQEKLVEILCF